MEPPAGKGALGGQPPVGWAAKGRGTLRPGAPPHHQSRVTLTGSMGEPGPAPKAPAPGGLRRGREPVLGAQLPRGPHGTLRHDRKRLTWLLPRAAGREPSWQCVRCRWRWARGQGPGRLSGLACAPSAGSVHHLWCPVASMTVASVSPPSSLGRVPAPGCSRPHTQSPRPSHCCPCHPVAGLAFPRGAATPQATRQPLQKRELRAAAGQGAMGG